MWLNTEEILYIIGNKKGEVPRNYVRLYAKPISGEFEKKLSLKTVNLEDVNALKKFVRDTQGYRYHGVNFLNVGKQEKNTIEFRLSNGTIDSNVWIENINLFGGMIRAARELAEIQKKTESEVTNEEKTKLNNFESIKKPEISEQEKLENFLLIAIPEEDREIYRERYEVNKELIKQTPSLNKGIKEEIATKPVEIGKIGENVIFGSDNIEFFEYNQGAVIIEQDLENRGRD